MSEVTKINKEVDALGVENVTAVFRHWDKGGEGENEPELGRGIIWGP